MPDAPTAPPPPGNGDNPLWALVMPLPSDSQPLAGSTVGRQTPLGQQHIDSMVAATQTIADTQSAIKASVQSSLSAASAPTAEANALIVGSIQRGLAAGTPAMATAAKRAKAQIGNGLFEGHGQMQAVNAPWPTADVMAYSQSTGDYLSPVGLHPDQIATANASTLGQVGVTSPIYCPAPGQIVTGIDGKTECYFAGGSAPPANPVGQVSGNPVPPVTYPPPPLGWIPVSSFPPDEPFPVCQPPTVIGQDPSTGVVGCYMSPNPVNPVNPVNPANPIGVTGTSTSTTVGCATINLTVPACPVPVINVSVPPAQVVINNTGATKTTPCPPPVCTTTNSTNTTSTTSTTSNTSTTTTGTTGTGTTGTTVPVNVNVTLTVPSPPPPPPEINSGNTVLGFTMPDWGSALACVQAALFNGGFDAATQTVMGFGYSPTGEPIAPSWYVESFGKGSLNNALVFPTFFIADKVITYVTQSVNGLLGCQGTGTLPAIIFRMVLGFVSNITGGSLDPMLKGLGYSLSSACPQEIPSQAENTSAWLAGAISDQQWDCWTEANNAHTWPASVVAWAQRSKASFTQGLILWRWGKMSDADFSVLARQNGVIEQADFDALVAANVYIPGPSDLMRYMVRDVADPSVVTDYGLLTDFAAKWQGGLAAMGNAQGITTEVAQYEWAAHWQYPSYTQAAEMFHRLRPDKYPGEVGMMTKDRANLTTQDDFAKLLGVNDMAPWWRQRMVDISYRPLSATAVRRLAGNGVAVPGGSKGAYQDVGYKDTDAQALSDADDAAFAHKQVIAIEGGLGEKYVRMYVSGLITLSELSEQLARINLPPAVKIGKLKRAQWEYKIAQRKMAKACVTKELVSGGINANEALASLIRAGLDATHANDVVTSIQCGRLPRAKMLSASDLCSLRTQGLVNRNSQIVRLQNLGWSSQDAEFIASLCDATIEKKLEGAQQATQKAAAAAAKQAKADAAAAAKAAAAAAKKKCQADKAKASGKPPPC